MHLIYLDESGNTGNNLNETQQPVFVLAALVVPEAKWLALETDLQAAIDQAFPAPRPDDFEIHANELFIRLLRGDRGGLRLGQIIEKGFFIDSDKSLPLQLCDLCAFCLRRMEEQKAGLPVKPLDQNCIPWVQPLIHRGAEPLADVLGWLHQQQKKERPGT